MQTCQHLYIHYAYSDCDDYKDGMMKYEHL